MADVARSPERPGVGSRTKPVAPPVTWERDSVHFPEPLKPLAQSFGTVPAEQGSAIGFARWSLPVESFRLEAFDGYIYSRMEPFGGEPPKLLRRAMQLLPQLAHAWRLDPAVRRRILAFDKFVADGGFENSIDLWQDEWEPEPAGAVYPARFRSRGRFRRRARRAPRRAVRVHRVGVVGARERALRLVLRSGAVFRGVPAPAGTGALGCAGPAGRSRSGPSGIQRRPG